VAVRLKLSQIGKRFGEKIAIHSIDLDVAAGSVHAVCGENGAGKSTLMNILAGVHQPDQGRIMIDGSAVTIPSPSAAARLGIGMVHQHFTLVPSMTVAENVFLGRHVRRLGIFSDRAAMATRAAALIARYGFSLDVKAPVSSLSVGQRQRVEILKALAFDARILILDEPTAVLTPREVDELLGVVALLRDRGASVLFITHKLREAVSVSDTVTVIRDGRSILHRPTSAVTESEIAIAMVGRAIVPARRGRSGASAAGGLSLRQVTVTAPDGHRPLDAITLDIRPGEIVGIAGVDGNGQTELAEVVAGLRASQRGQIALNGQDMTVETVRARRDRGLGFIPEDRLDRGLNPTLSVAENLSVSLYAQAGLTRCGLVSRRARDRFADAIIRRYDIRGAGPATRAGALSGGNMQKIVVARELERKPKALVVAQPTRGIDVGAGEFVHQQLLRAAGDGCAVLLISSELSEIIALADRVGVLFAGRLVGVLDRSEATEARIGAMMSTGSMSMDLTT
jgi:ABC-type uncharacterized transport system ATPase subunit